jgi:hypothetical protein
MQESVVARTPSERTRERPAWLDESYADPPGFWKQYACAIVSAAPGVARSAVFEWYDLFYELAERHTGSQRSAIREYAPASGFRDWSYDELSQRAKVLAATWAARGVGPGKTVCVVVEVSLAYVIGLLAAWYCGATVTLVPPEGSSFVRWALLGAGVDPKPKPGVPGDVYVFAGTKARPWVSSFGQACLLPAEGKLGARPARDAHRFAAKDVVARVFSPLGETQDELVELSAEQLYLSLLRDGLLVMQLSSGKAVAAPGFSELQFKPALVLMTLACGATWVEMGMEEVGDGRALLEGKIDRLGVTPTLRERLRKHPLLRKAKLERWFRNVADDGDPAGWFEFAGALAPLGIRGMNYFANLAAAGSLLFSSWSLQFCGTDVWRSPGLPCKLGEPNGTGMPPLADIAMLVPAKFPKGSPGIQGGLPECAMGRLVLAVSPTSDRFIKNLGSHRAGMVLPEGQLEDVLEAKYPDWVRCATLVSLPTHGGATRAIVALLVFVHPSGEGPGEAALAAFLRQALGEERCPDRVEIFELNPKLTDPKRSPTEVDRAACRSQYISGSLWGKRHSSVFRQLAALFAEVVQVREFTELMAKSETKSETKSEMKAGRG